MHIFGNLAKTYHRRSLVESINISDDHCKQMRTRVPIPKRRAFVQSELNDNRELSEFLRMTRWSLLADRV